MKNGQLVRVGSDVLLYRAPGLPAGEDRVNQSLILAGQAIATAIDRDLNWFASRGVPTPRRHCQRQQLRSFGLANLTDSQLVHVAQSALYALQSGFEGTYRVSEWQTSVAPAEVEDYFNQVQKLMSDNRVYRLSDMSSSGGYVSLVTMTYQLQEAVSPLRVVPVPWWRSALILLFKRAK